MLEPSNEHLAIPYCPEFGYACDVASRLLPSCQESVRHEAGMLRTILKKKRKSFPLPWNAWKLDLRANTRSTLCEIKERSHKQHFVQATNCKMHMNRIYVGLYAANGHRRDEVDQK